MTTLIAVGAQWGDEGKGKLVDWLAPKAQLVVRFHGGNNAGHTLVVDGEHGFHMAAAVERLLALGWEVDVISEDFYVGRGLVESAELAWFDRVARQGARLHPRLRLRAVKGRRALCEERFSGKTQEIEPLALVVYALPELPEDNLLAELRARHPVVLRVGDAAAPRLMGEAILNAHRTVLLE